MIDLDAFEIVSFDCYGTLIDWETGLLQALEPLLRRHGRSVPRERLLAAFARLESEAERPPYRTYATVLRDVVEGMGRSFGFTPAASERDILSRSLPDWPAFPDTRDALRALKTRYRLAVISNTDDDLFARTAGSLGVDFDFVVTAQQVGSYKPSPENFRAALARFGIPRERLLHAAQSLFHDVAPARSLGIATVWVDRRRGRAGAGATPPADARPDLEVPDLASLVALAGGVGRGGAPGGQTD